MRLSLLFLILLFLFACKKKQATPEPEVSPAPANTNSHTNVSFSIGHFVGSSLIKFSKDSTYTGASTKYLNAAGDTFSVSKFRYYLSNLRLKKNDGSYFTETESYRLIDGADSTNTCNFTISNVPTGTYVGVEFMIGVDSARNCSGAQTGALDPVNDMYWSWNQGYIFMKFEGYSSAAPPLNAHNLTFHLGGFKSPNVNYKTVLIYFASPSVFDGSKTPKIYLKADLLRVLNSPNPVNFAATPYVTSPSSAKPVAANYSGMMSLRDVVN